VHAFNFVASESEEGQPIIEGRILERLLHKIDQMRSALADRVFDVIGEVLSLNGVNLPEILREAANDPRRLDEYLDQIERVAPKRLLHYEKATGIALARRPCLSRTAVILQISRPDYAIRLHHRL
jgi:hypothetical protein